MPIYEYRCQDCGNDFEYMQRMSDDPKSVCETCGGSLERLISRSAFHLKGGGWYKDLYSSPKPSGGSSSDSGGDSGGSKGSGESGSGASSSDSSSGSSSSGSSSTKSKASSTVSSAAS